MTDPRKPVHRPSETDQEQIQEKLREIMLAMTHQGSQILGINGCSFVIAGLGNWIRELSELDAQATTQMLESLAVIYDPKANPIKKSKAERKRRNAVDKIFASLDLEMVEPKGSA